MRKIEKGNRIKFSGKPKLFTIVLAFVLLTGIQVSAQVIFNNANLATGSTARDGTAAPTGAQFSQAAISLGDPNISNTVIGFATLESQGVRNMDDFNVPVGQTWTLTGVNVYAYQTNYTGTTSPFSQAFLRICRNGPCGTTGATVVFGDTTTNRFQSSADTNIYRISNTPNTARKIWSVTIASAVTLPAGNYWLEWSLGTNNGGSGFAPPATIRGNRAAPNWFALQLDIAQNQLFLASDAGFDIAAGATANIPLTLDFPFQLLGSIAGAPTAPRSRRIDFGGDNRTDSAVARSANATSATTWFISNNLGQTTAVQWGTGVGFTGGDVATPADYDGDGKTDIAVWRSGAQAFFYILQSSNNTFRSEPFGIPGDDPSVVGDYDGDGKADPAIYRSGANGFYAYRGSSNNPTNAITVQPWGQTGDVPIAGDFDGDRRFDFHVVRNQSGQLFHYERLSGGGQNIYQYGLNGDKIVSGDFDADGRSDIAAVRSGGSVYNWYVRQSSDGRVFYVAWGNPATDYITPGDYDGDNETDIAVWRTGSSQAFFYVINTFESARFDRWGTSAGALTSPDYPVASFTVK